MKKLGLLVVFLFTLFMLVGCGVSEKYAEKVNKAAEKDEHLTYTEVIEDLGDPIIDLTGDASFIGVGKSGACTWVKGCKTKEDYEAKIEAKEVYYELTIVFSDGKATKATWTERNAE